MFSFNRIDQDPIGTTPQQSFTNYMTALYAHVNSAEDKDLAAHAKKTLGDLPAYSKEQDLYIGRAIVSQAGYTGNPYSYLHNNKLPIPENALSEQEIYQHIGKDFVKKARTSYAQAKTEAQETASKQTAAIKNGLKNLPAILAEDRLPNAKEMAELTNAQLGDRFHKIFGDVFEAIELCKNFNPVTEEDIAAEITNIKAKERQDYINQNKFAGLVGDIEYTPRHDDAYYTQQAHANKQQGYKLTRGQMKSIIAALKDEQGKLDPAAVSLFIATLNEKVNKQKTIDSAFWRNFTQGAVDYFNDTTDFAVSNENTLIATTGSYLAPDGEYRPATQEQIARAKEWVNTYGTPEIETLRAGLNSVHENAFNPADQAKWYAALNTKVGSIAGREAFPLAASVIATRGMGTVPALLVGGAVGGITRYPSIAANDISQAYAENLPNPRAYGTISAAPEAFVESIFSAATGIGWGKAGIEAAANAALSVPALARAAGTVQSSALLRWATGGAAETIGELFIEDPAAALTNKAIFRTINTLAGHDVFAEPEWSNVTKALTANTEDPRNAAAIAAYSFILGAFGIGGDLAKAHQFARNREALLTAGHSQNAATEISRRAEELSEKLSTIAADRDLSAVQKYQQQNKLLLEFNSWQQEKLRSDILDADFETLRKRYQENNLAFMEKTQAIHAIRTGAADAVLKQDGIQKSELAPNGNRILTLTYTEQNEQGAEEIKTENIELSEPQYLNYIAARTSQNQRAAIVAYQNAALGNAAVRKARTTESIAHDLINMRDLAAVAPAYQYISQRGALDYQGALLIAKSAKALHDTLIAQGMTIAQANAAADPTTGARLDSLINLPTAIKTRVESAAETTEGKALGIENSDTEVGTVALRLPSAKSLGDSIVLYIGGEATLANIAEELTESDLIRALNTDSVTLDTLKDNLTHLQTELREYDPNIKLLPSKKKENLTFSDIVEAYSTLQHLDILTRADRFNLTENSRAIIDYSLAQTDVARLLRTAADAWATFANSERGQHYLTTTGKTLSDLLDAAGMQQSKLYSDLRTAEEDRIATETAANFSIENLVAEQQKQLDHAAKTADQAAQTNTEAGLPRTEIPAEESLTGEPLTVDPLETADNNPATAEYNPATLTETTTDPRFISPVTKSPLGITGGMMPPSNLKPHPALTNTPQVGAADFSPHYNPNAKPILALSMPDGSNLIVAGRTRHQIALADKNCKAVKTTLIDYDPAIHTDEWVQMTNAGEHIINRTATTEHFRTYFTHNPITHAQAIEQGLVPIDPTTGQPSAAYIKGRQIAIFKDGKYSHASGQEPDVLTGEVPINIITHSPEVPQFKTNRAGNPAGQDGVVYALPGEYRTHDPIHLWQRKDGTVVIISGRHRLAKAIAAGATHIPATVFPETDIRNATWARVHDAEQNVLDNQASVADTALYVKGYNPKGRPLTEEESKQFTRKGSNSELGSYIGLHGSDTLIEYLSRGAISPEYAYKIAQFAPDDPDTQNLAVAELVNLGKGIQEALTAAGIYRDTRNNRDDAFAALFQSNQQEEDFNRFLASYSASKIRNIGLKRRPHKAAASERSVREHQEAGIKFENVARNRAELATLTAEQDKWRNPGLHPELRQEAYEEFKKTAEGAQDYFNFGTLSVIGPKALTWSKYVSRSFIGRDDGLPRAEIDASQFKFHFGKDRGETISKKEYTRIVKKMCVDMLEKLHQKGITEYNEKAKTILEEEILETILPPDFVKAYYSSGYKTFTRKNAEEYAENNAHLYLKEVPKKVWKLEDIMDAPELYAAYPQLRDILVMDGAWKLLGLSTGAYINNTILLNNLTTKNDKKKTILHEIQHTIQEIEGFAFGSSPEYAFSDLQNAINRETPGSPRYNKLKNLEKRYKNSIFWQPAVYLRILTGGLLSNVYDSQDIYERSAGEIEARNVEARSNWSAEKRERIPFNQTLSFSAEEAIVSSPEVKALFQDGVLPTANAIVTEPGATLSIRALHASPHNFRKFSTDFMGSGEGVQAFGWGLYFMTNVHVNKSYFAAFNNAVTNLTDDFKDLYKELEKISITIPHIAELRNNKQIENIITSLIETNSGLKQAALKSLSAWNTFTRPFHEERNAVKEELAKRPKGKLARFFFNYEGIRKALERYAKLIKNAEIYAPEIKERWESHKKNRKREVERISVRLEEISQKLEKLQELQVRAKTLVMYSVAGQKATNYRVELNADDSSLLMWDKPVPRELHILAHKEVLLGNYEEVKETVATEPPLLGHELYKEIAGVFGSMKSASEWLAAHGYKGIKYLDGISRKAGKGTYNYVIFSGDDIKITSVNESGIWSMEEGWEDYTDPTATFSLRRSTVRNWKTLLSERERTLLQTADYINRQAQRTARVLGADTEAQRAGVHFAQATAIITALDKYIFSQDYITRGSAEYRKLRALRNYAEQYISVARKGKLPTRRATKDGRITVKAAIRELLENQLPEARETAAHTIEKKGGNQKTEKELTSELIARLANQNATEVIAEMLQTMGDIIHTHLRNSILDRITTSLKTLRPKTNPYGRAVRNTIDADTQYRLGWVDTFLNLTRAERATWEQAFNNKEQHLDQLRQHLAAPPTERQPLPEGAVKAAYDHLASRGGEITIDRVQDEVASLEYAFQSYAYLDIGTYQDALQAFLRLNRLVLEGRHGWDAKLAAEREQRQSYIDEAIAAVGESKAKHAFRSRKKESAFGSFFDSIMSAGQLFESLTETDGFRSIARDTLIRISNASPAILQSQKETENALVEAWLRLFKPQEYAALPINTASRNKAIRKHLERGFNDFVVDMQKEIETDITLEHELAPSVQAVRERQGHTAPQDFGEKLILSKGQILNILLTAEQPEYQKNMLYHGYTQAVQNKLRTLIGEEYIQFGYAMRTLLLNSGVAEVYAERTGHNLPDNPYYWPASIDHITHTKGDTKPDEDNKFKPASSNTFLKRRVVSMGEVKGVDALTVFRSNMAGRMNYIHMQPIADTWHSLLANPHFAHRLEATIGSDRMQKLKTALDVLINSAWGDTQLCGAWAKFCSTLQSARAISLLSGNIGTLVRQLTAVNHVGMQLPSGTAAYAKAALLAIQGKSRMSISQMMRSATFQARMQGNKYYEELLREGADASWNKLKQTAKNISGLGMDAIAAVDAAANAFSATVLYNIKHDYYSKSGKGYTEQEIHERCMQDVAIMLELCAQPLLQHQKSLLMATTTNAAVKAMGFMTTELLNKFGYARARYLKAGGGWKGTLAFASAASAIGIPTAIIGMLLQYATDDIPDDEIDKWAWITSNAIQGVTGVSVIFNLPLIGDYFGQFFNPHTYGDKLWDNILPDIKNTHKHYGELLAMMTTNNSWTNADLAKTINQCARDTAQLAAQANAWIPILKEYTSTVSAVANALAAGSNLYAQSYNLTAWTRTDKRIPNSKNNTRKQAYRQSSFEKTLTNIISDDNYEKRKAAAKRERSRNTRRQKAEEKRKQKNKEKNKK